MIYDYFRYDNSNEPSICGYYGTESDVSVPFVVHGGRYIHKIGECAFEANMTLKNVVLGDFIQSIGADAFSDCVNLESVDMPKNLQGYEMGSGIFSCCLNLKRLELPKGLLEVPAGTFQYCASLEEVIIPDGCHTISYGAFQHCESLKSIVLPDSITEIGTDAFKFCKNLESIKVSSQPVHLGNGCFRRCDKLHDTPKITTTNRNGLSMSYFNKENMKPLNITIKYN